MKPSTKPRRPRASFLWLRLLLSLMVGVLAIVPGKVAGQPSISKEYQIKAAFLFNFAQFIEWPTNTFTNVGTSFSIGILGDDPFGKALDETVQGETIQQHRLVIRRSQRLEDLQDCQIIFISKSEKGHLPEILSKLGGKKMLTVSELQGFASHGGVINFYLEGNKVRFEINPSTAQREGLKISSQLLSLGKIIESETPKEEK
jgi:YfiR/HmsC-like